MSPAGDVTLREYIEARLRVYEAASQAQTEKLEWLQKIAMPRGEYQIEHKQLLDRMDALQRIVWIGYGIMITLQFIVGALLVIWREK